MKQLTILVVILAAVLMAIQACNSPMAEDVGSPPVQSLPAVSEIPEHIDMPMQTITAGRFVPLYGSNKKPVSVKAFRMSRFPVTNKEFLTFVKQHPAWRKSLVKKVFAEENYLSQFSNDTTLAAGVNPLSPVTHVSWYAANAFCSCYGYRLPTVDEWEYVAMANETQKDARTTQSYNQYILGWYEKRDTYKNTVGSTFQNVWGVYDLHGLVWEWTDDFNSVMISGDNRNNPESDKELFCGSGSVSASDLMNYAAFMRYAFRGSIKAKYTLQNLGFRCAESLPVSAGNNK